VTLSADGSDEKRYRQPIGGFAMKLAMLVTAALLSCAFEARAQDWDEDGVPDAADNCLNDQNPQQLDPDLDGYGNRCDGDFDQDGDTDQDDSDFFSLVCMGFPIDSDVCDLDEDGVIGTNADFMIFASLFGAPPGPSGLACAGTVPCTAPPAVPSLGGAGMGALLLALIASAVAMRRRWLTT
jgi:hypothetical protein